MKKTKKDERINLRLPLETKELLKALAEKQDITSSEYIRLLIERAAKATANKQTINQDMQTISHEQMITNSLSENHFINQLLVNKEISNKGKKAIGREMRKYVRYQN